MYRTLTNVWENELDRATVEGPASDPGPRQGSVFSRRPPWTHFVIGDPNVAQRRFQGATRVQTDPDDDEDDPEPNRVIKARSSREVAIIQPLDSQI